MLREVSVSYEKADECARDLVAGEPDADIQEQSCEPNKCKSVEDVSEFFVGIQSRRGVPEKVMRDIVAYMKENASVVCEALSSGSMPTYRTMRQQALKRAPRVLLDICYNTTEGKKVTESGLKAFPKAAMAKRGADHLYTLYYVSLDEVCALHTRLHPSAAPAKYIDISVDGVPESKSGGKSVDILSIRFLGCRGVYSLAVLQPTRRGLGLGDDIVLEHFLEQLEESDLRIRRVIADAPKRAGLRGMKQHSAMYSCPYCKAGKMNGAYPASTFGCEQRTNHELRDLARRLEEDDFESDEDKEELCRGIKKQSPLSRLPYLDLIKDIPTEPMHLINLGLVRRIMNLSFSSGSAKAKQVSFRRSSDLKFNTIIQRTLSLPQFSRRTRNLDIANYKAEEFRNLVLGFWPAVLDSLPPETTTVWILTVYLVRAYSLTDEALLDLKERVDLTRTMKFWYEQFEKAYGTDNCSYTVHVFTHLDEVRNIDTFSELSAVLYEDHYNLLKRSYRPGTASIGMQALQNLNLSKFYNHSCQRPRTVSLMSTGKVEDRYVFVKAKKIVKLTDVESDSLTGLEVPVAPGLFLGAGVDLTDVWCYRAAAIPEKDWKSVSLKLNDVVGKCVVCEGVFSVFTFEMMDG